MNPPPMPPGLNYLMTVSSLFVKQQLELLEIITGFETQNKYAVKNQTGQTVYYASEQSDCCSRNCCGPFRGFEMPIVDIYGHEIIHLIRPFTCNFCNCCGCCKCCLQKVDVYSPPGTLVGTVQEVWTFCIPKFKVLDPGGNVVLRITGPCCQFNLCCNDVEFKVLSSDGQIEVGKISKKWSGFAQEIFTDADFFGISFPLDLDVKMKATLLGALFLIDFMFFED